MIPKSQDTDFKSFWILEQWAEKKLIQEETLARAADSGVSLQFLFRAIIIVPGDISYIISVTHPSIRLNKRTIITTVVVIRSLV